MYITKCWLLGQFHMILLVMTRFNVCPTTLRVQLVGENTRFGYFAPVNALKPFDMPILFE